MSTQTEGQQKLTPKIRQLLEEICEEFGSEQYAKEDPEFVLELLLEMLNKKKMGNSALSPSLRNAVDESAVRYYWNQRKQIPHQAA